MSNITVGIDVGTYQVKVVIAENAKKRNRTFPHIIGTGLAMSKGLRHGYIINSRDVGKAILTAVELASKEAKVSVRRAYLSVGGVGLDEIRGSGTIAISGPGHEVYEHDIKNATDDAERKLTGRLVNRKILHAIPLSYHIDGQQVLGRPEGMKGNKLSVDMLFITTLEQHLQDLIQTIEERGISIIDVMASPLAGSLVTLSKAQKIAGCVLTNIGAETVSIVVFENSIPISLKVFPIGGNDITNDIALNLKISLEDAEQLKRGALIGGTHSKKYLDEIISGRLSDIFDLIESHLKKIGKSGLLPAGIMLSGGSSGIATIDDIAKAVLRLPSKRATLFGGEDIRVKNASWAVAYGLTIWGVSNREDSFGIAMARQASSSVWRWFKQFLP